MTITHKLDNYDLICGNCGYTYDEIEEREYLSSKGKETLLYLSTCPKCGTIGKLEVNK